MPERNTVRSQFATHDRLTGPSADKKPGYSVAKMHVVEGGAHRSSSSGSRPSLSSSHSGKWAKAPAASHMALNPYSSNARTSSTSAATSTRTSSGGRIGTHAHTTFDLPRDLPAIDLPDPLASTRHSGSKGSRSDSSWARIDTAPHNPELSALLPAVSGTGRNRKTYMADRDAASRSQRKSDDRSQRRSAQGGRNASSRTRNRNQGQAHSVAETAVGAAGSIVDSANRLLSGDRTQSKPGLLERLNITRGKAIAIVVLVMLVLSIAIVYPAAREYYVAQRGYERANIELSQVQDRNAQIQGTIDFLSTDQGVEDYVREQYGWVKYGEIAGAVTGLPPKTATTQIPAQVDKKSIAGERTWANNILDFIFAVDDYSF